MRITARVALALAASLAFLGAAPAPSPSSTPKVERATPDAVTHHSIALGGKRIAYTARAGTIDLHDDSGALTARMFYVAYTADGSDLSRRPVTFCYNGGPGSSSVWLHMGSYAPVRVVTANGQGTGPPPFQLVDNADTLLDKSDLVFVDAPNTGFSRVVGAGKPVDFMGVDQDARAFRQFIERYDTAFDRWNSPKFLFGESYGTTRDCVLAMMLQDAGTQLNGVVLLSSILNFGLGGGAVAGGDYSFVGYLPTMAATAWYHHKAPAGAGRKLDAFLADVERFAGGEYMHALAQGSDLDRAEFDRVVRALHGYTGLPEAYIRDSNLRVPYNRFLKELLRGNDMIAGRYDGRFTTYDLDGTADSPDWDPSDVGINGVFVGTFNRYIRESLHYRSDLQYRPTAYGGQLGARWDMHHDGEDPPANVAPDLAKTMAQNPGLHVFSANGQFDFATPYYTTVYTLSHLNLPPALQGHITYGFYESGHMVYLNPEARARFKADLSRWYDAATRR
jgi:carboxypeptidase C (cathepsin A)